MPPGDIPGPGVTDEAVIPVTTELAVGVNVLSKFQPANRPWAWAVKLVAMKMSNMTSILVGKTNPLIWKLSTEKCVLERKKVKGVGRIAFINIPFWLSETEYLIEVTFVDKMLTFNLQ